MKKYGLILIAFLLLNCSKDKYCYNYELDVVYQNGDKETIQTWKCVLIDNEAHTGVRLNKGDISNGMSTYIVELIDKDTNEKV